MPLRKGREHEAADHVARDHRGVQVGQPGARLDAQLFDEHRAGVAVGGERVRLATGPVEGRHQETTRALAERMLGDQLLELAHDVGMAPEGKVRFDPPLERQHAELLETSGDRIEQGVVRQVGERRAAPQGERLAERRRGTGRISLLECPAAVVRQLLEPLQVERPGLDANDVRRRRGSRSPPSPGPCAARRRTPGRGSRPSPAGRPPRGRRSAATRERRRWGGRGAGRASPAAWARRAARDVRPPIPPAGRARDTRRASRDHTPASSPTVACRAPLGYGGVMRVRPELPADTGLGLALGLLLLPR